MIDYAAWEATDPLTVEDAAYLWAGIDPASPRWALTPEQRSAHAARLKMLSGKISAGLLKANTSTNGFALIGRHEASLVARDDLKALAESIGQRPPFLFPPTDVAAPPVSPNIGPPPKGSLDAFMASLAGSLRAPQKSAAQEEAIRSLSHRPGSPLPPRRTKAPPPPPYLGGGVIWPPAAASRESGPVATRASTAATNPPSPAQSPDLKKAVRRPSLAHVVGTWYRQRYPNETPKSHKVLMAEYKEETGVAIHERTMRRARGGK